MRKPAFALLALAVVVLAVAVGLVLGAGRLVKRAVEREGTASLRLQTTLDRASVSLLGGKLGLDGLAIASPRGFSAPHLLEVGRAAVSVHYGELRRQPVHVGSVTIDGPTLVIEQSGGALNFRKAMELMPAAPPGKQPMKLVIDELKLEGARVLVRPGLPGLAREVEVAVPPMTLRDIGRGRGAQNGAAMKDVAMTVVSALAAAAARSDAVPAQVRALLRLNVSQLGPGIAAALPGAAARALSNPGAAAKDPASLLRGLGATGPSGRSPPAPHR